MLENGFIKISRKMTKWRWYDEALTFKVFMHLIITANYEDKEWHSITIKRGQRITSYRSLASELKVTVKTLKLHLKRLSETGEINVKTTSQYTLITILNYSQYQDNSKGGVILNTTPSNTPSSTHSITPSITRGITNERIYKEDTKKAIKKDKEAGTLSPLDAAEQPEKKLPDFDLSINRF